MTGVAHERSEVSAVIPTHLRAALLAEALESVFSQTRRPTEVIVVDDAADADTEALAATFARRGSTPVRYVVNRERPGACGSRNLGAASAQSSWIAFLDDDDIWLPGHLETSMHAVETTGADFAVSGLLRRKTDGTEVEMRPIAALTPASVFDRGGFMTGSNLVVSQDRFRAVGGFDPAIPVFNDWDLFYRLVASGARYAAIDTIEVEWREHGGDRITTSSVRRADGIDIFLRRYGGAMPASMRRRLATTAIGIRRRHARTLGDRAMLAVRLAAAYGVAGTFGKLLGREGTDAQSGRMPR